MNEFIAKSRLTRGLIAIAALAVAIYLLGNTDGVRRAIVAISTALFAWIATCELEVFKTEIALKMKQLDWKKELLGKADSCFFDLKLVFEDVSTSLAFKPAGETDEQYVKRASACWSESVDTMVRLRRELWSIRTHLDKHTELDTDIQAVSREVRGLILIQRDLIDRTGTYKIKDLIDKQNELKTMIESLDSRFKTETVKLFEPA
jgi:hypothetical protein